MYWPRDDETHFFGSANYSFSEKQIITNFISWHSVSYPTEYLVDIYNKWNWMVKMKSNNLE